LRAVTTPQPTLAEAAPDHPLWREEMFTDPDVASVKDLDAGISHANARISA
jgi:hypothetical protein